MRKQISIVIVIGLIVFSLIAVVAKSDTEIRLQQLDLKTKNQEIDIKDNKLEALQVELDKAKGDSKELERIQKEFDKLKAENEALQAKKAEEQRLAQAQASNVAQASSETPTDPSGNVAIAQSMASAKGWTGSQWDCLYGLWMRESGFNHLVENYEGSGAYGIPQSLPANKMASHGADYLTNPRTQIAWGLDYIASRYATPCGAKAHSDAVNWY